MRITSAVTALVLLAGCATPITDTKTLAAMEPAQLIRKLAADRPIQIAGRARVMDSIERLETPHFITYQTHYVALKLSPSERRDDIAAKQVQAFCEAKGGIYPDKSFGQNNNLKAGRRDCVSLTTGKLLFSVFTSISNDFFVPTAGNLNYNLVALAVPKSTKEVDPASEIGWGMRDLPHNYLGSGTIAMQTPVKK